MKWNKVKLGAITNNLDGKRKPLNSTQREAITQKGLYPYIGANNIMGLVDEYLFDEEILCVAEDGGSWGKNQICAVIYNERCWVNNHAHVMTAKQGLDLKFLKYYLNQQDLNQYVTGSTRGKLTKGALQSIEVPLPPLEVQQRIANTLDTADALRRKDHELLRKYDDLAQSIFNEMFEGLMGTAKQYSLVDLAEPGRGNFTNGPFGSDLLTSELTDSGVPVIYIRDIRNGVFQYKSDVFVTKEKAAQLSATRITSGDVLLAKVGDPPGATAVYPAGLEDSIITQDVIRLRPDQKKVLPKYLQYYFNSEFGKNCLKPIIVEGTRSRFGLGDFKKLRIPVPSLELQQVFTNRIQLIEQLIGKSKKGAGIKQLFDSLLEKYFN